MGQKVNPISMRLQVNKEWTSKWFASKNDYAKFLEDDLKVRRHIVGDFLRAEATARDERRRIRHIGEAVNGNRVLEYRQFLVELVD